MKVRLDEDFEIEIDDKTLDNYELVEALAAVDKGKTGKLTDAVDILFGDAKPALFEHIKEKKGYVSTEEVKNAILQTFESLKGKKS